VEGEWGGVGVYSQSTLLKRTALVAGALIHHCTNGRAVFPITCWVALAPKAEWAGGAPAPLEQRVGDGFFPRAVFL